MILSQASIFFEKEYKVKIDWIPSLDSSLQGIFIGTFIPLVSSIMPIQAAFRRNLTDALDIQRSKTQAMYVNILYKNRKDVSSLIMFGVIAIGFGFGVYYLLPLSLVSFNFSLAMTIFFGILFGMILALGLLSTNMMPFINLLVAKIFLLYEYKSTKLVVLKNLLAHKDRNKMTSLMFSLTLGFIIFLNIVCRIPFSKDFNDIQKAQGAHSINIGSMNLPIWEIEQLVRKHEHAFEAFGAVTNGVYNKNNDIYYTQRQAWSFTRDIDKIEMVDLGRRRRFRVGVVGVSPGYVDAIERGNLKLQDYDHKLTRFQLDSESTLYEKYIDRLIFDRGGMTLGEQLYSARGSQSAGISKYIYDQLNLDVNDVESRFMFDVYSNRRGSNFYELRPAFSMSIFGRHEFKDSMVNIDHDSIVSLPLYCKLAGIAVNEIDYESYVLKLKPEYNNVEWIDQFNREFDRLIADHAAITPVEDPRYKNFFWSTSWLMNSKRGFDENSALLDEIFNVIVLVSMCLCFFSLSSSMSANIYEQNREISVMRSFGCTKSFILKIYIYESLVLVISSSIAGFGIGVFIGNLMTLQQAMLQSSSYKLELPWGQLKVVIPISFICAFASTWGSAQSLLRRSIPEI